MANQRISQSRNCKQCGNPFFPFRAGTGAYCSRVCRGLSQQVDKSITCVGCGVVFTVNVSHRKKAKYCSNPCYQDTKKGRTMRERLYEFVQKTDYCWLWTSGRNKHGYGRLYFQGAFHLAHRLMYKLEVGDVPDNLMVRHYECDNPPCVNPAHLRIGTAKDNMDDAKRNNRHAHGETSYAKLKEFQVIEIFHDPRVQEIIAKEYGIARRTVGHIKMGGTWKHLNLACVS